MERVAIRPWWGGAGDVPPHWILKLYYLEVFFVLKLFLLAISWGGGGEVELFGGEASPAPPSLDETLTVRLFWCNHCLCLFRSLILVIRLPRD